MSGKDYTCSTGEKTRLKVTDFVVGSNLEYVVSGNKAKLKSSSGKQVTPSAAIMISAPRRSA
jgi:hypothetical protein